MTDHQDTRSIVTGAASGIGFALAEALLDRGGHVLLSDVHAVRLSTAMAQLSAHGPRARSVVVDVADLRSVEAMVDVAMAAWGRIDLLFNNAGIGGSLPIAEATVAHWQRIVDINLWGVVYGVHAVLPHMRKRGQGHIVNTASIAGLLPFAGQSLYNTTKFAVVGLSESLRHELHGTGVRVSVVCPGPVVSEIWGTPILGEAGESRPPPDAISARDAAHTILAEIARDGGVIVLPRLHRWLWRCHRWWPGLLGRLLRR